MPEIIDEILKDPSKLKLGGQKRRLSILFTDIEGFTTISEKLAPEELVSRLNEYLTKMTEIILENRGVVDKYIGDAIMAFWGAPLEDKEAQQTYLACKTAIELVEADNRLKQEWKAKNLPIFNTRIGINTREVIVGNIGSDKKFDYTVIGDHVNLASRLEGANKSYGTNIIISESTYELVKDKINARFLDLITVKGKSQPIKIYELLPFSLSAIQKSFFSKYDKMISLYQVKKFKEAKKLCQELLKLQDDKTVLLYLERCVAYIKSPPSKNWDGVARLTTK